MNEQDWLERMNELAKEEEAEALRQQNDEIESLCGILNHDYEKAKVTLARVVQERTALSEENTRLKQESQEAVDDICKALQIEVGVPGFSRVVYAVVDLRKRAELAEEQASRLRDQVDRQTQYGSAAQRLLEALAAHTPLPESEPSPHIHWIATKIRKEMDLRDAETSEWLVRACSAEEALKEMVVERDRCEEQCAEAEREANAQNLRAMAAEKELANLERWEKIGVDVGSVLLPTHEWQMIKEQASRLRAQVDHLEAENARLKHDLEKGNRPIPAPTWNTSNE